MGERRAGVSRTLWERGAQRRTGLTELTGFNPANSVNHVYLMLDQITPLILTYNEAPNIARTLKSVSWAKDVVVIDSFSNDATVEISTSFSQVRLFQRRFDFHRNQWEFGLRETGIATPWVLALDADYVVSNELTTELAHLRLGPQTAGYRAN